MTVLNAFQTVVPKGVAKDPVLRERKPGYAMSANGRFSSPLSVPNRNADSIAPKETAADRDWRISVRNSIDTMQASPLRKKDKVRRHTSSVFVGV